MAVIGILAAAGLGALGGSRGTSLSAGIARTAGFLESARAYAVTHNTYVYVLANKTDTGTVGAGLELRAVASLTGNKLPMSPAEVLGGDWTPAVRNLSLPGLMAADPLALAVADRPDAIRTSRGETDGREMSFQGQEFPVPVLAAFAPGGEVSFPGGLPKFLEILVREIHGTNFGIIHIAGITGQPVVHRK